MQDAFLELVKEKNVEEVKLFLETHASYQGIASCCNKKNKKDFETLERVELDLNAFEISREIQYIQNIPQEKWDNIVYKTWFYLGPELESSTIDKALLIACKQGNAPMINLLLSAGFNRNPVILIKSTPNTLLADSDFKKSYLEYPGHAIQFTAANPNSMSSKGKTALELAIQSHSQDSIKYLLLFGARFNSATFDYCAPLIPSLLKQATEVEKYCLAENWAVVFPHLFMSPLWAFPLRLPIFLFNTMMSVTVPFTQFLFRSIWKTNPNTVKGLCLVAPPAVITYSKTQPYTPLFSPVPDTPPMLVKPLSKRT